LAQKLCFKDKTAACRLIYFYFKMFSGREGGRKKRFFEKKRAKNFYELRALATPRR